MGRAIQEGRALAAVKTQMLLEIYERGLSKTVLEDVKSF